MNKVKRAEVRKRFNKQEPQWRIEAVIHDGSWYDFDKWMRVAKVTEEELQEWIDDNEDILYRSSIGSYRVDYDEIIRWYKQEELSHDEQIIPGNFPPKLWGNTTETQAFLDAPRRRVGTVSFEVEDNEMLRRCEEILKGTAKIFPDKNNRYKAHGLSAVHIKQLLSKGLSAEEFESLNVKTRAVLMQRELMDLPELWLAEALEFYTTIFAPSILRTSMSTIEIYLPDRASINSQTVIWVITAMKKFNEEASVPFSGYLSTVLRHWPYDLPDEHLGKELADFQRQRKRAVDEAQQCKKYEGKDVPIEVLAEIMDISVKEYLEFQEEHEAWMKSRTPDTLTWDDSSNEKAGQLIGAGVDGTAKTDREKLAKISLATVKAAVDTKDYDSAFELISHLDHDTIDQDIGENLSKEFIQKFALHLSRVY